MKIESSNDVQPIQHLDQPGLRDAHAPSAPAGGNESIPIFGQALADTARELSRRSNGVQIPAVQHIAQLYDQLGHPANASLTSVSRRIWAELLKQQLSVGKLIDLTDGDPARAFVVLKHVIEQADAQVHTAETKMARTILADLEKGFKGEIQAGLNIAVALLAATDDPKERQAMRELYYNSVVNRQSLTVMLHALLDAYGGERFLNGLNVMRGALADDMAARASSISPAALRSLLKGLGSCSQLGGVFSSCQALVQRLNDEFDPVTLLKRLLACTSTGLGGNEIPDLLSELRCEQPSQRLMVLNSLYPAFRQLPLAVWPDEGVRKDSVKLLLIVMDQLTQSERLENQRFGAGALA
ncbi:type III secretion system gatekeeper subunit SctW [Pseudomonas sp. B6002]|uniref:type III secretion system gatekeeper subunit SctW n=1 Tax=Pseudomonas sp. B6002 TaxID=2726978 RepID=UPI0015A33730|nr:type III secretion system gatekeeper subunit SctW [Pseudomonas sp. B6002]NVZ49899.1 type III secretion system gatekeeper subunit SctW [Pseudomonas sp. B6002]